MNTVYKLILSVKVEMITNEEKRWFNMGRPVELGIYGSRDKAYQEMCEYITQMANVEHPEIILVEKDSFIETYSVKRETENEYDFYDIVETHVRN